MARITVVATELPVPLPGGRIVQPAGVDPEGTEVEADLFVRRRIADRELAVLPPPVVEEG